MIEIVFDPNIKCKKCGYDKDASEIHLHHLIPKFMGGTDKDGRVYLCGKCHNIIHSIIIKWVWDLLLPDEKEAAKVFIKEKTANFIR